MRLRSSRLRPAPGIEACDFDREVVLLNLGRGEYFSLNEVGAVVWQAISVARTWGEIVDDLAARYDVPCATLEADLDALVEELLARGLVMADDAGPSP